MTMIWRADNALLVPIALAIVASGAAALVSGELALATAAIAAVLLGGVYWGATFEQQHARGGEYAWMTWLLLPSVGALGATMLARMAWELWAVLALVIVTLPTIMIHAMFMGQRDKPEPLGGGAAPTGTLLRIVNVLPLASACAVLAILAVAGIVEQLR